MCNRTTGSWGASPGTAGAARRFVGDALLAWGVTAGDPAEVTVDDVRLATSELVTNAVVHAGGPIELRLETHSDEIRVEVTDPNPAFGRVGHPDISSPTGRGLLLIDAIGDRWGQHRNVDGTKTVWWSIGLSEGSALRTGCHRAV